jgi:hypothetical protein
MARKSPWQEFAENFQGVYGTFKQIGQDVETGRIMDDEKFTAEGKAGAGLSGDALEKARYKALGDIYTKYGNAKDGLAVRTQLADLESKDRENTINQGIMKELAYLRGQGAVRNLDANSYASEGAGLNSRSSADDRTATLAARLLRMQADTDGVMSQTEERNRLLQGKLDQQAATLAATNASTGQTVAQTDEITQLLPGKVAGQLADLNLTTAQTNRIEELLSGEKALQGQQLKTAIANIGLTEANTKRVLDLLPGQIQAQTDASGLSAATVASVDANTAGQLLDNETAQAAADIRAMETGFLTQINDPAFRAANNIETEEDAQAALLGLYKSSNIPIERQMAVETALNKHGIGQLQNVAVETAQAAKNELQKGGLPGVIKWFDGVDDGTKTQLDTRVVDGVHELFKFSGTGSNRTETVLHSGASEAELEAKLMGQITNPGSGLEIAASILEMRSTAATIDNKDAQTLFTVENTKGLAGNRAYTNAQLDLANVKAREIRAELRQKYTKEGKAELALQRDQKALDKFLTDNLPILAASDMDVDALVEQFLTSRQQTSITFDPAD